MSPNYQMNAWLITWEQPGGNFNGKIAGIISSRRKENSIADFVQLLYLRSVCTAKDMAFYANRPKEIPFKVQKSLLINNIPHGERILCGSNSHWLYARKVTNLHIKVDEKGEKEVITWTEPPTYKWQDDSRREIELDAEGDCKSYERAFSEPLSKEDAP